ncbi:unnamed protein product [Effrenium voratum]|nr:unnamed protein product [Effrenium voratum]
MSFTASTAGKTGGCLAVMEKNFVQHRGVMRFDHCHAGELGGGFSVLQLRARGLDLKLQGELILHNCSAWLSGGAFYTTLPAEISLLRVGDVGGGSAGGASLGSQARLNLQDLRIENHVSRDFIVLATSWKLGLPVQCPVATNRCAFHGVHDGNTSVPLCPAGAGLEEVAEVQSTSQSAESIDEGSRRGSMGCYRCDPDYFQLQNLSRARCQRCPRHTDTCLPNELRMWEGYMLLGDKGYICPNPRVCPGGALPFNQPPMCAEGYVGQGCMTCASTHGISDASILSCVRCALSSFEQLKQGAVTVVKDGAIFAMAAFGAMASVAEGREAEVKISGILVNQLMAFSTVASTAMSAVLETSAAKALRKDIATSLQVSVHLVDFAQGESSGGFSTHCMLSYLGLQRGMVAAHVLVSVVPIVLMLLLAWKEPTMAFVVGSNCFMPRFCADFCKYCVFFRVEVGGELLFPYLPAALSPMQGIWMASLGFGLCLVLVVSLWVTVASSKQKPMPATVAYLVRPYRPECAAMEVERLVRKTLLKSAAAALPAVSKPASQLACVSLVMSCSLASYALFMPYKISKANYSEVVLLLAGLLLAILTNWLVANDIRGDASIGAQLVLLAAIALLGTSISVLMMGLILYFWRLERAANQT